MWTGTIHSTKQKTGIKTNFFSSSSLIYANRLRRIIFNLPKLIKQINDVNKRI